MTPPALQTSRVRLILLMLAAAAPACAAVAWLAWQTGAALPGYLLAGLAGATLLILALAWQAGDGFVLGPMRPVLHAVRRVAGGDLSARIAMERIRDDEISKLASEVDRMAEALSQRDRALTEARDRAQAYLDIVGVMVVALNARGHIALANRKTCEVLGCKTTACNPGVDWFATRVAEEDRREARAAFARILAGDEAGTRANEYSVLTARHRRRLIAWHHTALRDPAGRIIGMLSAGEDITERRQLQEEQASLQRQLQQAQKMEALGQLTGGIAHDFNNILASVLGFAGLALRRHAPDPDDKLAEYLREIIAAGERARDLVAKMLAFGRAQPGQQAQCIAPAPLVKEAAKVFSATIPAGIRIDIRLAEHLPDVAIDPVAFHQILMNLVINARDAVDGKGHITIGLARSRVDRQACTACHQAFSGDYLELTVGDDGCGIAPELLPRIFEPFFTTKEVGRGSGMGLAMVHGLVRRADGHFLVKSRPGAGTAFHIYLPAAAADAAAPDAARLAGPVPGGRLQRVMVVDDEGAILRLLEAVLKAAGWRPACFDHPMPALAAFRAAPGEFAAVISDQTMPDMSGSEMIAAMRVLRPDLKAILCTGYSDSLDEAGARALGIGHFFLKPTDTDLLLAALADGTGNDMNTIRPPRPAGDQES